MLLLYCSIALCPPPPRSIDLLLFLEGRGEVGVFGSVAFRILWDNDGKSHLHRYIAALLPAGALLQCCLFEPID